MWCRGWKERAHVPLCDNPSDSPQTKRDANPYAPSLPGFLRMMLWEGSYVYVRRGDVAVDNTRDDDLVLN